MSDGNVQFGRQVSSTSAYLDSKHVLAEANVYTTNW
jgi:hypothetical protein